MKVKVYNIGGNYHVVQAKLDAKQNGMKLEDWLLAWFHEINDGTLEETIVEISPTTTFMEHILVEDGNLRITDFCEQIIVYETLI